MDNDNVIALPVTTIVDLPLETILEGTRQAEVTECVVLGYDSDGEFYLASQTADPGKMLVLLELCRSLLINRLR